MYLLCEPMLVEARQTFVGASAETKILRLRPRGPENGPQNKNHAVASSGWH